jgi:T5SS/PEP-CTERM-associated repeat protein
MARALLLFAALAPLRAEAGAPTFDGIALSESQLDAKAVAESDLDGDGVFNGVESDAHYESDFTLGFPDFALSGSSGGATAQSTVTEDGSVSTDGKVLTISSRAFCSSSVATGATREEGDASVTSRIRFLVGTAGSFEATGSLSGSGGGFGLFDLVDPSNARTTIGANYLGSPASVPLAASGPLAPGYHVLFVMCGGGSQNLPGGGTPIPSGEGLADVTFVATAGDGGDCDGDVLTWAGGRSGAFGEPENWDPPQVPTFVEGETCDTALVEGGGVVVMDLASVAARGAEPAPVLEPRGETDVVRLGRLRVRRLRELRPQNGRLELDQLEPLLDEQNPGPFNGRSLEIGGGASLRLDAASLVARYVSIGDSGPGELEVAGNGATFRTRARLGVGGLGEGRLVASGGTQVTSAEALLGELAAKGTAVVQDAGTLWTTGNLAVGYGSEGELEVRGGARVESAEAYVGIEDSQAVGDATVSGADAQGNRATWAMDSLEVRNGELSVEAGGIVDVAGTLRITGADETFGQINVRAGGQLAASDVRHAGGLLFVDPDGLLFVTGTLAFGGPIASFLTVRGPTSAAQVSAPDLLSLEGESSASVREGGRVELLGTFNVGTEPGSSSRLIVFGARPQESLLRANEGDVFASVVGASSDAPAGERPTPTGTLRLAGGRIELTGPRHDLVVDRLGRLEAEGGSLSIETPGVLENHGVVEGPFILEAPYVQGETGTRRATILFEGEPAARARALDPMAATGFPRRALRKKPALPVAGPMVVTGDATLAGRVELQFGNGVAPRTGEAFEVLDVGGQVTGAFAEVAIQGLVPGSFDFEPSLAGGKLALTSLTDAVALPSVSVKAKARLKETAKKGGKIKLKRTGDTSAPLVVAYTVGGTAQPGVDYEALPGVVEIPARKKSATIVVKPIADGAREGPETIELELAPNEAFAPGLVSGAAIELLSKDG